MDFQTEIFPPDLAQGEGSPISHVGVCRYIRFHLHHNGKAQGKKKNQHVYGPSIDRDFTSPLYEDELQTALYRLNPGIS